MKSKHWAKQKERGNALGLNITRLAVQYFPLWGIRIFNILVVSYFYLTARQARHNIHRYYYHLTSNYPELQLPSNKIFRHFLAFGEAITDRFAVWQRKIRYNDLWIDDADNLYADMNSGNRGQLLVCSHFGNIEICRALVDESPLPNFKLTVLVHNKHAEAFNQALVKAGASELEVLQVEDLDTPTMLGLVSRIERGEWIAIAADRIPVRGEKTAAVSFLGQPAQFPQGAWLLASLLKTPLNTLFCIKENGRYHFKLRRFSPTILGRGKERSINIQQAMQRYAELLEQECRENPQYWFNFYDFWNDQQ